MNFIHSLHSLPPYLFSDLEQSGRFYDRQQLRIESLDITAAVEQAEEGEGYVCQAEAAATARGLMRTRSTTRDDEISSFYSYSPDQAALDHSILQYDATASDASFLESPSFLTSHSSGSTGSRRLVSQRSLTKGKSMLSSASSSCIPLSNPTLETHAARAVDDGLPKARYSPSCVYIGHRAGQDLVSSYHAADAVQKGGITSAAEDGKHPPASSSTSWLQSFKHMSISKSRKSRDSNSSSRNHSPDVTTGTHMESIVRPSALGSSPGDPRALHGHGTRDSAPGAIPIVHKNLAAIRLAHLDPPISAFSSPGVHSPCSDFSRSPSAMSIASDMAPTSDVVEESRQRAVVRVVNGANPKAVEAYLKMKAKQGTFVNLKT